MCLYKVHILISERKPDGSIIYLVCAYIIIGGLVFYAIFNLFLVKLSVSLLSWRNEFFLEVNQQPSVSN